MFRVLFILNFNEINLVQLIWLWSSKSGPDSSFFQFLIWSYFQTFSLSLSLLLFLRHLEFDGGRNKVTSAIAVHLGMSTSNDGGFDASLLGAFWCNLARKLESVWKWENEKERETMSTSPETNLDGESRVDYFQRRNNTTTLRFV